MLEFLPARLRRALDAIDLCSLYELRVRSGKPLRANLAGSFVFLGERGAAEQGGALVPTREEVEETLLSACGYSLYSVENQLRQGFVTAAGGERIGVAGTYVYENGAVHSVHTVTSLCIRIPHAIRGCGEALYRRCFASGVRSLLLLSPPGEGKTTILRDLARLASEETGCNLLVVDERGELAAGDLGPTADVVRFLNKRAAFTAGIRAMRPDLIVTDELLPEDYSAVQRAIESGIVVFASAHLTRFEDVPNKLFSRYAVLDGLGTVKAVYGERGEHVA